MQNVCIAQPLSSNPFHSSTKCLEGETRIRTTHRHTPVIIIQASPLHPEQIIIIWTNWYDSKSIFYVSFCQKAARACQFDKFNCIIDSSIAHPGMLRINTIINRGTFGIRQMVYQTKLSWSLFRNNSQWGDAKWMQWRKLKGAGQPMGIKLFFDFCIHDVRMLKSRNKVFSC